MQPIIRRTLTITVTETWTITWPDGQETVWHTTQVVDSPTGNAPSQPYPQLLGDDNEDEFNPAAADQTMDEA